MLTTDQLAVLRRDLRILVSIEYDEILNEILDHYASLTEQKMANGQDFEQASRWAWADMGSGAGIQELQDKFIKALRQQVANRHKAIIKSYFRWPTVVATSLLLLLAYLVVAQISAKVYISGLSGVLILCFLTQLVLKKWYGVNAKSKIASEYLIGLSSQTVNLFQLSLNLPAYFFGESSVSVHFIQTHAVLAIALFVITVLYMVSFIQLSYEKFIYKPA